MISAVFPSLSAKTVFVTGGGSGIGAAIVSAFARQGANVTFVDIADESSQALVAALADDGLSVEFAHCDITDLDALKATVEAVVAKHGAIDVLINNAASDDRHNWWEVTGDYWDERMAINLRPQFFAIQAAAPAMIEAGCGSIINFGSIAWKLKLTGLPAYTVAKSAVQGLTRCFAKELGPSGIRVNSIVPGAVITERQLKLWITPSIEESIQGNQCIKKRLLPDSIAAMALFLGADESDMCTGQDFVVDAGWT